MKPPRNSATCAAYQPALDQSSWLFFGLTAVTLIVLMAAFPTLGYLNNGHCDAWYYFGPMIAPIEIQPYWGRVMLTAPFSTIGLLLGLDRLEQGFFFVTVFLSVTGLYIGLATFFSPIAAATTSLVTLLSGFSLAIASTTYSVPALMYGCIAFALFCRSVISQRVLTRLIWTSSAGAFIAFAANCHFGSLFVFGPMLALSCISSLSNTEPKLPVRVSISALGLILGFALGVVITCVIAAVTIGTPWPALKQLIAVSGTYFRSQTTYDPKAWQIEGWWKLNGVLPYAIILATSAIITIYHCMKELNARAKVRIIFTLVGVGIYGFSLVMNFADKLVFLNWSYYINWYLLPIAFSLCAFLDLAVARGHYSSVRTMVYFVLLSICCCTVLWLFWPLPAINLKLQLLLFFSAIVAIGAAYFFRARTTIVLAMMGLLLPICFQSVRASQYGSNFWTTARDRQPANLYSVVKGAVDFIAKNQPSDDRIFWTSSSSNSEVNTAVFRSFGRCTFTPDFPKSLPDAKIHWQSDLKSGQTLAILMAKSEDAAAGQRTLGEIGLNFSVEKTKDFSAPPYELKVQIGTLRAIK